MAAKQITYHEQARERGLSVHELLTAYRAGRINHYGDVIDIGVPAHRALCTHNRAAT